MIVLIFDIFAAENLKSVDNRRYDSSNFRQNIFVIRGFVIQGAALFRMFRTDRVFELPIAVALPKPVILWKENKNAVVNGI